MEMEAGGAQSQRYNYNYDYNPCSVITSVIQLCDTKMENLFLYGFPRELWEVNVPPDLLVPTLGINFDRDGKQNKDWLSLVAMHSDAWKQLFDVINDLPTINEVVTGMTKKQGKEKSSVPNHSKPKSNSKRGSKPQGKYSKAMQSKDEDEDDLEVDDEEEHGETLCGTCGLNYAGEASEFSICCDNCDKWFHGKCVKITPARVEGIKRYKCPSWSSKRARP
ncbi:hypothetical protein GYH30_009027 [Glycine max]|uniref:PHD finger protein ALFIN-LIKE n=1 Tax=Glycine max TaxID=3847 RepID=A0A0R0K9Y0_SOYBN|nr:hypothetical protein GYH30_009027 [Glycine max]